MLSRLCDPRRLSCALVRFSRADIVLPAAPKLGAFDDPYASIEAGADSAAHQPWRVSADCPRSSCQQRRTGRSSRKRQYGFHADGEFEYGGWRTRLCVQP
jgi:hypothetical protein